MSEHENKLPENLPALSKVTEEQANEMAAIGGSAFQKTLQQLLSGKIEGGIRGLFKAAMDNVNIADQEHKALHSAAQEQKALTTDSEKKK
jgi:hypothetical protein